MSNQCSCCLALGSNRLPFTVRLPAVACLVWMWGADWRVTGGVQALEAELSKRGVTLTQPANLPPEEELYGGRPSRGGRGGR